MWFICCTQNTGVLTVWFICCTPPTVNNMQSCLDPKKGEGCSPHRKPGRSVARKPPLRQTRRMMLSECDLPLCGSNVAHNGAPSPSLPGVTSHCVVPMAHTMGNFPITHAYSLGCVVHLLHTPESSCARARVTVKCLHAGAQWAPVYGEPASSGWVMERAGV